MRKSMIMMLALLVLLTGCGTKAPVEEWGTPQAAYLEEDGIDIEIPEAWTADIISSDTAAGVRLFTANSTVNSNNALVIEKVKNPDGSTKNTATTDENARIIAEEWFSDEIIANMKEAMEIKHEKASVEVVANEEDVTQVNIDGNNFYRSGVITNITSGFSTRTLYTDVYVGNANSKLYYMNAYYENEDQKQILDEIIATMTFTPFYAVYPGSEECAVTFSYPEEWSFNEEPRMIVMTSANPALSIILTYGAGSSHDNDELQAKLEEQMQFISEQMQSLEGMEDMENVTSDLTTAEIGGVAFNYKSLSLQKDGTEHLTCDLFYGSSNDRDYTLMISYEIGAKAAVDTFIAGFSFNQESVTE